MPLLDRWGGSSLRLGGWSAVALGCILVATLTSALLDSLNAPSPILVLADMVLLESTILLLLAGIAMKGVSTLSRRRVRQC